MKNDEKIKTVSSPVRYVLAARILRVYNIVKVGAAENMAGMSIVDDRQRRRLNGNKRFLIRK